MRNFTFLLFMFLSVLGYGQMQVDLPITFEDGATVNYDLVDFGGNASMIVADPTDGTNMVGQADKSATAQLWAGTTNGNSGLANPIPFNAANTKMSVRVWSPDANTPIRLKVEDASNPAISVETEVNTTGGGAWETLEFDFSMEVAGTAAIDFTNTYNKVSIFFNFGTDGATAGAKTYYWDDIQFITVGLAQVDLPITFDDAATVDYNLVDFGGNTSMIVVDPTDGTNMVGQADKSATAQLWAGTTNGDSGLANAIPFAAGATKMSVRVWSPDANTPIRLKVEDVTNPTISVETEVNTTVGGAWETLEFDFSMEAPGTAAINLANTYDKLSIFFNFGTDGATAGAKTYYWDDVQFVMPVLSQVDLPITFEDQATVDYDLVDFGGNASMIVVDPTDGTNMVGQADKSATAQLWAGTTMGNAGLANPIPFNALNTKMSVRVWSPDANTPIRLKVEDASDPTISVETEVNTTGGGAWETLEFDFSMEVAGTAAIDFTNTYNKVSIFFNFGTDGATAGAKTYYWDDVQFVPVGLAQVDLPITFEDQATVDYDLVDFGGNASMIVVDPTDGTNMVGQADKSATAQLWAGTTMGNAGLANPIPFNAANTKMSVRVWSPDANTPIRLKVEDASNPSISVETEVNTTVGGAWETLEFDFSMEVAGTAAIDFTNTYNKVSIFFNFGTDGATAGAKTYYWDDVQFVPVGLAQVDLPITFEDQATVDYDLVDFGGNASMIVVDPTDGTNMVGQADKSATAQLWAGTTNGDSGLANAIPFTATDTKMSVRVWSPDANTPIRLKVEDASDPTISVETEVNTTMPGAWETLEFDFSMEVAGTAALDINNTYNKVSIFFNFGTDGATAGAKTYYWDDVQFVVPVLDQVDLPITFEDQATVDYDLVDFGGNASMIVVDPTDGTNMVGQADKGGTAEVWAGTTNGGSGLANAIPFTTDDTQMSVRVWSPDANTPILLKVEDASNPSISVEVEVNTTMPATWETLVFNFSNPVAGTPALNLANTYDKVSIFFNFGTDGATAGAKTYYWDDVKFIGGGGSNLDQVDLPITFEDEATIDYNLVDFGGNVSMIVVDPTDGTNMVGQVEKTNTAETWAGTTNGDSGLANPIPFTATETKMTVRVWSPDANTPIRLKVEDVTDPTISVETEVNTTVAEAWETLEFDFSMEAPGTAAIDVTNTYDKVSIFFNFGTDGATAGSKTYYWDDIQFGELVNVNNIPAVEGGVIISPNPARDFCNIEFLNVLTDPAQLSIFDANGRLIRQGNIAQQNTQLNISDLSKGVYFIQILDGVNSYFQKLIIVQ